MNPGKFLAVCGLSALILTLGACSVLDGDKVEYKSTAKAVALDIPPDLTQLSRDTRYTVGGGSVSASSYQVGGPASVTPGVAATVMGDVRIERAGAQRWLVVGRTPEQLWEPLKEFWQKGGFVLTLEQQNLGIMETDWAENRAKLPQDFIRNTLGKVFDSLYSTGERDKFRTRLERIGDTQTEIYISHRGMQEVTRGGNGLGSDGTIWQPRAPDPELEAEFLRRLMVKLGSTPDQAKLAVNAAAPSAKARVISATDGAALELQDTLERAWRRIGLALDRTGFTVEDRDRSQGTYYVRYVESVDKKNEPGFFAKLFGGSAKDIAPVKYRVVLRAQGEATVVSVRNAAGAPDTTPNAQRILQLLADDLK